MTENLCQAVVIGASAGAIEALSTLLPALPSGYRLPVLIVVHVPPDRKSLLPDLFRDKCAIKVVEADDKEPVQNGVIYFAPPDYHLLVETGKTLSLSSDEPVLFSRPSVDVLFESAADAYGAALTAVILSGASQDGAKGLAAVVAAGGEAMVLRPGEAYASAMPEAAIASCPTAKILSLAEISLHLQAVGKP
jgi:two-component system chemotaxis response regulator CheB